MSRTQAKKGRGSCQVCGAPTSKKYCSLHATKGGLAEHGDKYAAYRPETTPTPTAIAPCNARHDRGLWCSLPLGHDGDHLNMIGRRSLRWR
jgi:hypothetical protein